MNSKEISDMVVDTFTKYFDYHVLTHSVAYET